MIERVAGTLITPDDADYVLRALQLLTDLLGKQGSRPTPRLAAVTDRIAKTVVSTDVSRPNVSGNVRNPRVQPNSGDDTGYALIDTAAAARILGCTPGNVRDLRRRGVLSGYRVGGRWAYPAEAVMRRAAER
ncbi:DNA-binding protein [Mycobacterium ahvazicum]|uniref:DNA-binding protein n=2 Tax=Mycobacterium ahvazicum TaxID=1964395 RepID=A0A2K4YA96_9MYCO|nr:DNA-binding protein [Mycobacterium ahvazicum]